MPTFKEKRSLRKIYVRPNDRWLCGRSESGGVCPRGPNPSGECGGHYECEPACVDGQWRCTRPEPFGGRCDQANTENPSFGPLVKDGIGVCCRPMGCVPVRSLRAKRRLVSIWVFAFTVGVLMIGIGGPWRNQFTSPGPLSVHHQGAIGDTEDTSCNVCHQPQGRVDDFAASALHTRQSFDQNKSCIACHGELAREPANVHGLPSAKLATLTVDAGRDEFSARTSVALALASVFSPASDAAQRQMACASCHQEHRGRNHDMTFVRDVACQSCHVKQFESFEKGHPEFASRQNEDVYTYPYTRRTRIVYDHIRHDRVHFRDDDANWISDARTDCVDCHTADANGRIKLNSFESSCASCHTDAILSVRNNGHELLGYPFLEPGAVEMLLDESDLRSYPNVSERVLSYFPLFFLSLEEADGIGQSREFMDDLKLFIEFEGDLSGIVYEDDLAAVARNAEAVERLYDALSEENGVAELTNRLRRAARPGGMGDIDFEALLGPFSGATPLNRILRELSIKGTVETGGWHVVDNGYRIDTNQWHGLLGAIPAYAAMKSNIESAPDSFRQFISWLEDLDTFQAWFRETIYVENGRWKLREGNKSVKGSDWKKRIQDRLASTSVASEGSNKNQEIKSSSEVEAQLSLSPEYAAFFEFVANLTNFQEWISAEVNLADARWTLREPRTVFYRPLGHADPFLRAWLDLTGDLYAANPVAPLLFDELSGRSDPNTSPGTCIKCHSVDVQSDLSGRKRIQVNWRGARESKGFTNFNHGPHLKLFESCKSCHDYASADALDEEALTYLASFRAPATKTELGVDFDRFTSNFSPIKKSACVQCHTRSQASNACRDCHNYHVDDVQGISGGGLLSDLLAPEE